MYQISDIPMLLAKAADYPLRQIQIKQGICESYVSWSPPHTEVLVAFSIPLFDLHRIHYDLEKRVRANIDFLGDMAPYIIFSAGAESFRKNIQSIECITDPSSCTYQVIIKFYIADIDSFCTMVERMARSKYERVFSSQVEQVITNEREFI